MSTLRNRADVTVRADLAGDVLPAVVAMLAARAECPLDRIEDALLLTDAVAAHAPGRSVNGSVQVEVAIDDEGLQMTIGGLQEHGADGLIADATLPLVGAVIERVADELHTDPGDGGGEQLVLRLRYTAPSPATMDNVG